MFLLRKKKTTQFIPEMSYIRWPPIQNWTVDAVSAGGCGLCVSPKHGVIVTSSRSNTLSVYSAEDGSLLRSIGETGTGKGQFRIICGGMCASPDGDSVLVADDNNHRVQEVRIVDGSWVRFVGGEGVLRLPMYVDCNATAIAVSETHDRISVFSWRCGGLLTQFGPRHLQCPRGLRLLANDRDVVVADHGRHRLCVFRLSGECVQVIDNKRFGLGFPNDMLECVDSGDFIVTDLVHNRLAKMSGDTAVVATFVEQSEDFRPCTLAALPDGGLVMRAIGGRLRAFKGLQLRFGWLEACAVLALARHAPASPKRRRVSPG